MFPGADARTCLRGYLNCLFGCCTDGYFIYCCLSNGAGIGIIIGVIVMVISTCVISIGVRRHRGRQRSMAVGQQASNIPGTTVTQLQTASSQPSTSGYGQPNSGYGQPNTGYGQPNTGYGQPNTGYGQPNTGYGQPNTGYAQPNTGYGQPNPGCGQPTMTHATAPPPYDG
ncbi:postacrosomal sheath WW domain-binding protein-like [Haliotis rufescens]|uniref:postacrosomal sheath WW domain-binding protein-like n=1 Tax=Haliotis rufescens TaxID=6454 RepID=UPI00201EBFA6|nr:postacrosomal sheath WW domain-binding protein-like [Haliotis rufescens]